MALLNFRNISCFKSFSVRNTYFSTQLRTITSRTPQNTTHTITKESLNDDEDLNKPIEFLKSDAARWKAHVSRSGVAEKGPWFQPYVISISLMVFMAYFFFLREESDIDLEFDKNLYDRISGLEEKNLEIVLQYNKEHNIPTSDIESRLKEIRK